jgi:hypothetical protein
MGVQEDLLELERQFWAGGESAYLNNVDTSCLVAFSSMAGVSSREEIAKTVGDSSRWKSLKLELKGTLSPSNDVAMLTYRATATRGSDEKYTALVSSGYVQREGRWKLMFHQQTPLDEVQ